MGVKRMISAILALFVNSGCSQRLIQAFQCGSVKAVGECNAMKACTWCKTGVVSGCYQNSFQCARKFASREQDVKALAESTEAIGRRAFIGAAAAMGAVAPNAALAALEDEGRKGDASEIKLVTFDGKAGTQHNWGYLDDSFAVFGGVSQGGYKIDNGVYTLDGYVAQTPSTKNPGFLIGRTFTDRGTLRSQPFPDVTSCEGISFTVKSDKQYNGYKFAIGYKRSLCSSSSAPRFKLGYKANFNAPVKEFGVVRIPFKDFTFCYNSVTGNPIETCAESPENCVSKETLENLKSVAFLAEGTEGDVKLQVKEISAYGCGSNAYVPPAPITTPAPENLIGNLYALRTNKPGYLTYKTFRPQLATLDVAIDRLSSWYWKLTAASFGLLVAFIASSRPRPTPVPPSLLG